MLGIRLGFLTQSCPPSVLVAASIIITLYREKLISRFYTDVSLLLSLSLACDLPLPVRGHRVGCFSLRYLR